MTVTKADIDAATDGHTSNVIDARTRTRLVGAFYDTTDTGTRNAVRFLVNEVSVDPVETAVMDALDDIILDARQESTDR